MGGSLGEHWEGRMMVAVDSVDGGDEEKQVEGDEAELPDVLEACSQEVTVSPASGGWSVDAMAARTGSIGVRLLLALLALALTRAADATLRTC